jgi:hypothetical protein
MRGRWNTDYVLDRALNLTGGLKSILELLDPSDRYDILPRNWLQAFDARNPSYFRQWLGELTVKRTNGPHSLLGRFTFNGDRNNNEMMKYFRTDRGDRLMAELGLPKLSYHRAKTPDRHLLLSNLTRASLELGVRADPNFTIEGPRFILDHRFTPEETKRSIHPFSFQTSKGRYMPDDKPLVLFRLDPRESRLLLSEDDRKTEGMISSESGTRLHDKFEKIFEVWKRKLYERKYGHKAALLLFKTINERHAENVCAYVAKAFGPTPWLLIKAFPEFRDVAANIPVTTKAFNELWMRPGCRPFSLKTLSEV